MNRALNTPHTVTPWGIADSATHVAEGITFYSTPSHGGYLLSPERRASMPPLIRDTPTFAGGDWYEEDCDWALVALAFPAYFPPGAVELAHRMTPYFHGLAATEPTKGLDYEQPQQEQQTEPRHPAPWEQQEGPRAQAPVAEAAHFAHADGLSHDD